MDGISEQVSEALVQRGFRLNYDPVEQKYRPWYGLPYKVTFSEKGDAGSIRMGIFKRKINIPINGLDKTNDDGPYKTIDDVAGGLLHETGHADIFPVEFPVLVYSLRLLEDQFSSPALSFIAWLAAIGIYVFTIREMIVEGYNCLKHGTKRYWDIKRPLYERIFSEFKSKN